jgi:flagellar motor protein MotB
MKSKTQFLQLPGSTSLAMFSVALALTVTQSLAQQKVVIEGGPGKIQISDRDGRPEPVLPGGAVFRGSAARSNQTIPQAYLSAAPSGTTEIRPVPNSPTTVVVPAKTEVSVDVNGVQAASPAAIITEQSVETAKRLAEIRRELGIADAATQSLIKLDTENLFTVGTASLDPISAETLSLIAEYISLVDEEKVGLTYHFAIPLNDKALAWDRSVALVSWMTKEGGLAKTEFVVNTPEEVKTATPTPAANDGNTAFFKSSVEILIQHR